MKTVSLTICSVLILAGCASGPSNYQLYADTQAKIAQANAVSDTARYNALLEIAKNGDSAAKVAAVLSIQMGQGGGGRPQQQVAPPEDWDTKLLRWAGLILPTATQLYGIHSQRQVAITQSNNAAATAASTNQTFATMSTNMGNSNSAIAKSGFDTVGAATTAITNVANSGTTAITNVANANTTAITNVANSGITGVTNTAKEGLTAATNISNNANTGMNAVAKAGLDSIVLVSKDSNTTMTALGSQASTNLTTVTGGYKTALDSAIAKLSGTTTTTTTTTTSTSNTTMNNVCPVGKVFSNGTCN